MDTIKELYTSFESILHRKHYPKQHLLHKEGTVCNHLYLIETGLARAYYHKDGQDITAHFAPEKTAITAIDSFIQRKRSRYNIELLEDSEVGFIHINDLQDLLNAEPRHEYLLRLFLQQIYIELAERIESIIFHSARERYDNLISQNPKLLQRVNLGHIASYVGITQETLSRIRAKS